MLTTAANDALTLNVTVPNSVEATAADGDLALTGTVAYGTERAAAELAVAGLTGVRNISDDIDVSYDANPVDVELARAGGARTLRARFPGDSDVNVVTRGKHHHADRPHPHLGRARRGDQRRLDGTRRHRRPRRT